jgi:hypothetical protein
LRSIVLSVFLAVIKKKIPEVMLLISRLSIW